VRGRGRDDPVLRTGRVDRAAFAAGIRKKIETLLGMKRALEKLTAACRKRETTGECPILEALADD
jgi:hypothetical protein